MVVGFFQIEFCECVRARVCVCSSAVHVFERVLVFIIQRTNMTTSSQTESEISTGTESGTADFRSEGLKTFFSTNKSKTTMVLHTSNLRVIDEL